MLEIWPCGTLLYVTTSEAVKALRAELNESQQEFSNRLHMALGTIAHYEIGTRQPDYIATLKLYRVACEAGRRDLAALFLQLINAGIVPQVAIPFRSESERDTLLAVQAVLNDARFQHLRAPLKELLAPVKTHLTRIAKRKEKGTTK